MPIIDRGTLRAIIIALGIATAGLLAGNGFARGRSSDRYVTVKGVAEKEVRADFAIWPLCVVGEYGAGGSGPSFVFSGLNQLKPSMIADATARAREAADQFARDSRSSLGGIRLANQGVFEILPRDQAPGITEESQVAKVVRVVATIDYYLR